jgi:hypothetical protein
VKIEKAEVTVVLLKPVLEKLSRSWGHLLQKFWPSASDEVRDLSVH